MVIALNIVHCFYLQGFVISAYYSFIIYVQLSLSSSVCFALS
jgi:hypothetical protein